MGRAQAMARKAVQWVLTPFQVLFSLRRAGWFVVLMGMLAAVVAMRSGKNIPCLVAMVIAGVLVASAWLSRRSLKGLLLRRGAPVRVEAGREFQVLLSVTNAKRLVPSFAVSMLERLPEARWLRPSLAYAEAIPAGGAERATYLMAVRRRGVYRFAPTRIESSYPFGLFGSSAFASIPTEVVVYPRMLRVSSALFDETDRRLEDVRRWRRTPYEEDFRGLRDYRHGDNPKWIHWRTSARLGKWFIREFEKPESKRITMLLETLLNPRANNPRRRAHLETGIRFAASLARECAVRGYEFTLGAFMPDLNLVSMGRGIGDIEKMLDALARLEPSRSATVEDLIGGVGADQLRDSIVLVARLGFAGVGEGGTERLEPPAGVAPELFWEVSIGSRRFREFFARSPVR